MFNSSRSLSLQLQHLARNKPGTYRKLWADFFKEHPELRTEPTADIPRTFAHWLKTRS